MTTLTQDTRVLADTAVDTIHNDGTATIHDIVRGQENHDFWRYPLTDALVNRLAKTAHDHYWSGSSNEMLWDGPATTEPERHEWRSMIRALFADLMDGKP